MEEHGEDMALVERCLEGDKDTLNHLRKEYHPLLRAILIRRGATATEAEDLLADLWADSIARLSDGVSLLARYNGRSRLRGWLVAVATNRLIDLKRHQRSYPQEESEDLDTYPAKGGATDSDPCSLVHEIVKEAFIKTIKECQAEHKLMIRLVYIEGLAQQDIVRIWHWDKSKVSRTFHKTLDYIRIHTLARIRRRDPWLILEWEDFLELAEVVSELFFKKVCNFSKIFCIIK